jgi:pyruvate/2-oxoglutarate dehydrogenase complex dihydrolipoamide dehydrogenase (E3) component
MLVIGAGPIGMEIAQAYRRLGSEVTLIADRVLPKDEPEAAAVMRRAFEREGVRFVIARADAVWLAGGRIVVNAAGTEAAAEVLFVASGRRPAIRGLDLEKAGVHCSEKGIPVDDRLRTNVRHIYAAGDVTGGYQFTHFAGWQAFQAVRNALLPGHHSGFTDLVPWVTYTDPEVAHVGLTELQAREQFGGGIEVHLWPMKMVDRAVCENDMSGFIKIIVKNDGKILGATIVAARAGETITEIVVAMKHGLPLKELAGVIHAYPTYSTAIQQMAAETTVDHLLAGTMGKIIRGVSKLVR